MFHFWSPWNFWCFQGDQKGKFGSNRLKFQSTLSSWIQFQAVKNFVFHKFGHQQENDLAKIFIRCLNHWKLETPTARKQRISDDELQKYKANYTRYVKQKPLERQQHLFLSGWCPNFALNPVSASPTKYSSTLKQFVGKLSTNCLSVFDHFMRLGLKGFILSEFKRIN